jgi:peptide/nickel transport system ATP-binding protein
MTTNSPLLNVQNLSVAYPNAARTGIKYAVQDISFQLAAGEKLGFVGESGSGKSTIGRAIIRLLPPTAQVSGTATFQGQSIFDLDPPALRKFRGEAVSIVFQDPMTRLNPLMTIGQHCIETILAHEPQISKAAAKQRTLEALDTVKIEASRWQQYPHEFSGGMRQRVAIALALVLNPKMIIADEPTTSLDVRVSAEILRALTELCEERNLGLMLISHDLAMMAEYCDRLVVMNDGQQIETGSVKQIFESPQEKYTQTLLNSALHIQSDDHNAKVAGAQKSILKLTNLQKHYTLESNFLQKLIGGEDSKTIKAVDNVELELYEGEIFGLVGESGCGKSTLSRTILQLIPATGGQVEFMGKELTRLSLRDMQAQRREMQMIFQDPSAALNPKMTIGDSIADALLIHNMATPAAARTQVLEILGKVGLSPATEFIDRYPTALSGGQQQRVGIARALITRPKLIICDEPVSMLDATVQTEVLDLMLALKNEFKLTYLFITHDLWLAKFLCDRIAVMNQGQIVEMGDTASIFNNPQAAYTKELLAAAPLLTKKAS